MRVSILIILLITNYALEGQSKNNHYISVYSTGITRKGTSNVVQDTVQYSTACKTKISWGINYRYQFNRINIQAGFRKYILDEIWNVDKLSMAFYNYKRGESVFKVQQMDISLGYSVINSKKWEIVPDFGVCFTRDRMAALAYKIDGGGNKIKIYDDLSSSIGYMYGANFYYKITKNIAFYFQGYKERVWARQWHIPVFDVKGFYALHQYYDKFYGGALGVQYNLFM